MPVKDKLRSLKKRLRRLFMNNIKFSGRNVPIKDVAKMIGKDQQFVRQGIINGKLPIGTAFKKEYVDDRGEKTMASQYDFYVSPKLLYEYTGIIYENNE